MSSVFYFIQYYVNKTHTVIIKDIDLLENYDIVFLSLPKQNYLLRVFKNLVVEKQALFPLPAGNEFVKKKPSRLTTPSWMDLRLNKIEGEARFTFVLLKGFHCLFPGPALKATKLEMKDKKILQELTFS